MAPSRSGARSVSTRIHEVSIGRSRMVASAIRPVSPMPPAVAQNRSGSSVGRSRSSVPRAGVSSTMDSTWAVKVPSRWWFLPWTSEAMAPPTVTCRVPGDTIGQSPSGTRVRISRSRLTPACTRARAAVEVDVEDPVEAGRHDARRRRRSGPRRRSCDRGPGRSGPGARPA